MQHTPEAATHTFVYRLIVLPFLAMLRMGASPEKLAWSIALGMAIGINPLLGSTTVLCLGFALFFRMNVAASQLANHLMYPLEIVLAIPFLRIAARIFHTAPIPLSPKILFGQARSHPIDLVRSLWFWEWHAMLVWAMLATALVPILAGVLTPLLRKVLVRVERHQYPLVPSI